MAIDYLIHWTDDALKPPFKLAAQTTNVTLTSLVLFGKGSTNWGNSLQQNMIRFLENFCSVDKPPIQPTVGQLWFNNSQNILKCYWNGKWNDVGYQRIDSTNQPIGPNLHGDLWYDLEKDVLKVYNGSSWDKAYQGGLPPPDFIPVPTPAVPLPVPAVPISPTTLPPGVPTPVPSPAPVTPTPVTPVTPTPVPSPAPVTPTPVTPTPVTPVTPTPVTPTPVTPVPTPISAPSTPPTSVLLLPSGKSGTWNLTFHDEFDNVGLNTNNWSATLPGEVVGPTNYSASSGSLKIWPTTGFVPRSITSDGKWGFGYGFFEMEARLPTGQGLKPVFYLTLDSTDIRPEIDVMTAYTSNALVYSSPSKHPINYDISVFKISSSSIQAVFQDYLSNLYPPAAGTDLSAGFHKYGVNIDDSGIEFYFDGQFLGKWTDDGTKYFNRIFYIVIGLYFSSPDVTTLLGSGNSYEINYVRVWTPVSTAPTALPSRTPTGALGPLGQDGSKYQAAFSDEFQETSLSTNFYNDHIWYASSNPSINYNTGTGINSLKIWPQRDSSGNFFDRIIDTDGKVYMQYGYLEVRAKLPHGKGLNPAIWLYTREVDPYGVAIRPRIDLLNAFTSGGIDNGWSDAGNNPTGYQVQVTKGPSNYDIPGQKFIVAPTLDTVFHVYGLKWTETNITFYFDGVEVYNLTTDITQALTTRMYISVGLLMGTYNGIGGAPDSTTPATINNPFEIDSIRTWTFI
jgi:beta-glucanase (GH16 family)